MSNTDLQYGKLPPQAVEFEEDVLGALMLESDSLHSVIDILKPESFYKESHRNIYSAILSLYNENEPIDISTVSHKLKKTDKLESVGGGFYVSNLTSKIASAAHIEFHARKIQEQFIKREAIRICSEALSTAYSEQTDADEVISNLESKIMAISHENVKKDPVKMSVAVDEQLAIIDETFKRKKNNEFIGVPSGSVRLDRITGGWQNTDLIILAARPSMGKTAYAIYTSLQTAKMGCPVAFFSLEMSTGQLINRYIAIETGTDPTTVRNAGFSEMEWERLANNVHKLKESPIYIDDTPGLSLHEFGAKLRRLIKKYGVRIAFIDYLQLMTLVKSSGLTREQEISAISRGLKILAKSCGIPIVALSQLNRSVETRGGDRKPQLSDLRESGAIEQDADLVLFIHRPEYYGITTDDEGNSLKNYAELIIAKHRNGELKPVAYYLNDCKTVWNDTRIDDCSKYDTNTDDVDVNDFIEPNTDFDEFENRF